MRKKIRIWWSGPCFASENLIQGDIVKIISEGDGLSYRQWAIKIHPKSVIYPKEMKCIVLKSGKFGQEIFVESL